MKNLKQRLGAAILGGGILANLASPAPSAAQGTTFMFSGSITGYQLGDGSSTLHGVSMIDNVTTFSLSINITNEVLSLTPAKANEPASFTTTLSDGTHTWSQEITSGNFYITSGQSQVNFGVSDPNQSIGLGLQGNYQTIGDLASGSGNNSGVLWHINDIGNGNGADGDMGTGANVAFTVSTIPEPSSMALLGIGTLAALATAVRSRRQKAGEIQHS